jgi:hypothetical protein
MMETLWDAIARLFGGGTLAAILPGDMPGDPNYRRPPGYDPAAARWVQISRALLEAGARVASAPRGQAVGQGLQGFIEGSDAGRQAYEDELLKDVKWRELEAAQQAQDDAGTAYADPLRRRAGSSPPIPISVNGGIVRAASPVGPVQPPQPFEQSLWDAVGVLAAPRRGTQDSRTGISWSQNPNRIREQISIEQQPAVRGRTDGATVAASGGAWAGIKDDGYQPILAPGSNGGGHGYEKCMLIPALSQFGVCFYQCPSGAIIRGNADIPCPPFRFLGQGAGPDSDMV